MKRCRVVGGMQYDLPPLRPNGSRFRLLVVVAVLLRLQPCLSVHFQGLEGYISTLAECGRHGHKFHLTKHAGLKSQIGFGLQ